jgi:hypothetical protein
MNWSNISKQIPNRRVRVSGGAFKTRVALGCKLSPSPYPIGDLFLLGLFFLMLLNRLIV